MVEGCSKEAFNSGLEVAATALSNWLASMPSLAQGAEGRLPEIQGRRIAAVIRLYHRHFRSDRRRPQGTRPATHRPRPLFENVA